MMLDQWELEDNWQERVWNIIPEEKKSETIRQALSCNSLISVGALNTLLLSCMPKDKYIDAVELFNEISRSEKKKLMSYQLKLLKCLVECIESYHVSMDAQ